MAGHSPGKMIIMRLQRELHGWVLKLSNVCMQELGTWPLKIVFKVGVFSPLLI